jgi:tetratricopeptide (TPR) repeat protein
MVVLGLGSGVSFAQPLQEYKQLPVSANRTNSRKRVSAQQSIVNAQLTSDEVEQGKINDVYQEVVKTHLQGDYEGAAYKYRSLVIPMAESAKSDVTRKKFLFLSYRGMGNCYLAMSRFTEAEELFQKLFEYLPVWPGSDDSDYPINFESIAMARIGQQRWKAAEESLQKAVSIFDDQIGRALTSGSDSVHNEHAYKLRMSQNMALSLFAVVYFREQRYTEALEILERAYNQGITFRAPLEVVEQIVDDGRAVSIAAGDVAAIAIWSKRVLQRPINP